MKAKTMEIFNKSKPETNFFGVKIQLSTRRAVYVANKKGLYCYPTQSEAEIKANEVNQYIVDNPDLEIKLLSDKTLKGVIL